jgi:hypothetical protein
MDLDAKDHGERGRTILYMQIKHGGFNSEATELKDQQNSSLSAETTTV